MSLLLIFPELPNHYKVVLPALSPTMEAGTIITWQKKEGDAVAEGDLLAEIETDKATMGFESTENGYMAKIFVAAGSKDVPIGKLICIIVEEEDDVAAFKDYEPQAGDDEKPGGAPPGVDKPASPPPKPAEKPAPPKKKAPSQPPQRQAPQPSQKSSDGKVLATPSAKRIAHDKGVDLSTGPGGVVRGEDVMNYIPSTQTGGASDVDSTPTPIHGAAYSEIPITNMRKTIAKRLTESKQTIPHYYLTVEINVDKAIQLRKQFNENLSKDNVKLSMNDFVIKASAIACQRIPEVNSSWMDNVIRRYNTVDINIAVATESGLLTPIVFRAESKGLSAISQDVQRLAAKAKEGKLQPQEFQGGTFTVSNLGMFGIKHFTAVINPPQACILAVGGANKTLVVDEHSSEGYRSANMMSVTLSCDHRVVDGAVGAQWLAQFKKLLENPETMLL
ncbi:hypothetical protein LOTGIDRAFT_137484 [Lottia gigantea]|uniref:Acetyltransferase component of pyruvate dehydrogenase complex n=1 Tax=Lottia gigantea TaxID=225164 RepID=V4B766_LOTGI|nr:hypothetical protein LOTGIDRAFT_137484 [Lottia gigantea]ESP03381.1 hypothetical protein LOTGIDRAFT_137484 [Lottia gigantea]